MEYEWDAAKRLSNIAKHGFDFDDAEGVFSGLTFTVSDDRYLNIEPRFQTIGYLGKTTVMIVWTPRNGRRRIISMRKSSADERREFLDRLG